MRTSWFEKQIENSARTAREQNGKEREIDGEIEGECEIECENECYPPQSPFADTPNENSRFTAEERIADALFSILSYHHAIFTVFPMLLHSHYKKRREGRLISF